MSSSEERRAQRHEVCNAVVAIADQLVQHIGYQCQCFAVVEPHASRKSSLGEQSRLGDDELVDLIVNVSQKCLHVVVL